MGCSCCETGPDDKNGPKVPFTRIVAIICLLVGFLLFLADMKIAYALFAVAAIAFGISWFQQKKQNVCSTTPHNHDHDHGHAHAEHGHTHK